MLKARIEISLAVLSLGAALAAFGTLESGCSGAGSPSPAAAGDGGDAGDVDGGASLDAAAPDAAASPQRVMFQYRPAWSGVTNVAVVGGFGQASDWTQPFATLTNDGTGLFVGSADLAPGQYLYVFHVTGDVASATPAAYLRFAIDPTASAYAACPAASPTFSKDAPNPCSQLVVPTAAASPTFHVRGVVSLDSQPAAGYLVQLDRQESGSHHFFVNRVTSAADGSFDLVAAAGAYRLQVLHPTYLAQTDATRDPIALGALRRAISGSFALAADLTVKTPDVAFHDYAAFAPRDAGTLPTHFTFGGDGGVATRLAIYGGAANEIGDPWFASAPTPSGASDFDGGFNTKQAMEPAAKLGSRYFWGTEDSHAKPDGGVAWTGQSMVFPITWR